MTLRLWSFAFLVLVGSLVLAPVIAEAGPPPGKYSLLGRNNFRLGTLELLANGEYTVNGAGKGNWTFSGGAVEFLSGIYKGNKAPYSDEKTWHKLQMNACAKGSHMIGSKPK